MKNDFETLYRNSEGHPYLSVRVYDCGDLDFYGKTFEEFYDLKEEDNIGSDFGRFGYDLFYRLGYCLFDGAFSVRKPNAEAKLRKRFIYNLIEPSESIEGPIEPITEHQLCGYGVHQTMSEKEPHLRHFTVYGADLKEITELSTNYYEWFVEMLEENLFGSSDIYFEWRVYSGRDPSDRRQYADRFFERYHRKLNGENVNYPISFDVWAMSESEIAELMAEDDIPF